MGENIITPDDYPEVAQNRSALMEGLILFDKWSGYFYGGGFPGELPYDLSRPMELPSCRCAEPKKINDGSN